MKKSLSIGVIILFLLSSLAPMSLGLDVKITSIDTPKVESRDYPFEDPPNEVWNKRYEINKSQGVEYIQQTTDGEYIITGSTKVNDNWDAFLFKTDVDGNNIFYKIIGGPYDDLSLCVGVTDDGGYVITGYTQDDPEYVYPCYVWLVKTDENGSILWEKQYAGPTSDSFGKRVLVLDDGYLIMAYDSNNYPSVWLLRTDINGNELWNKSVGSDSIIDYCISMIQTTDGDFVIVGHTYSTPSMIEKLILLIKVDANGNLIWRKTINEPGGKDIIEVEDNGYMIVGSWNYIVRLTKVSSDGEKIWSKTYKNPYECYCQSLITTPDGGYLLAGYIKFSEKEPGSGFVIRTDSNGNKLWEKTYSAEERGFWGISLINSNDGHYILSGSTAVYIEEYNAYEPNDIWLTKFTSFENIPPNIPNKPIGPTKGRPKTDYNFTTSSNDSDGEILYYTWSWWGNYEYSFWLGPYENDEICEAVYGNWWKWGDYDIRVKAVDKYGGESNWSDPLRITIPRPKTNNDFQLRFLNGFPLLKEVFLRLIR